MEATLVPSRTGLSCLGTDGPTLALEKKITLPQSAIHHCVYPLGSPRQALVCP